MNFTLLECIGEIDDLYILSAQEVLELQPTNYAQKQIHTISFKRYLILAAAIALILVLLGCAIIFGLRHLKVGEYVNNTFVGETIVHTDTTPKDLISLQGFVDSVSYKAAREWQEFLQTYDKDGALLVQADFDDYQEPVEYMSYMCYTQEMQDKIDAICSKYGLSLLGPINFVDYGWQVFDAVGISGITFEDAAAVVNFDSGYFYKDGSFNLGGTINLLNTDTQWPDPVNFQYRCVQKTSFDGVNIAVGDIDSYTEWNYILKDGTNVLLALNEEKALIIADCGTFFASVNIINPYSDDGAGTVKYMTPEDLETIADTFTFAYEPSVPSADSLIPPEWCSGAEN